MILIVTALVLVVCPLLLALLGVFRARSEPPTTVVAWDWRLAALSALLFIVAFNLVFFVQELFLVLLRQGAGRSLATRLFLIWVAYCGVFMALPQVVVGALSSGSDVGMAMEYFHSGANAKAIVALLALAAVPLFAREFSRHLLGMASQPAQLAGAGMRSRFIFQVATLPALLATALILPFRVPREWLEVVFLPLIVFMAGMSWIQSGAWRLRDVVPRDLSRAFTLAYPLVAVVALLLVFQLVLRPGIRFF